MALFSSHLWPFRPAGQRQLGALAEVSLPGPAEVAPSAVGEKGIQTPPLEQKSEGHAESESLIEGQL